jgi:GntR family transcriptional regulator/GntR family frlABCD operon transcriptional regulator
MAETRYRQVYQFLKQRIQKGTYGVGSSLPSENELCRDFSITRTTARSALDELAREGFIERSRGKRSVVRERRQSLGLLNLKGFSEAAGEEVRTIFLTHPTTTSWPKGLPFSIGREELDQHCIYFRRLRYIRNVPVMYETNWFSGKVLTGFPETEFVDGSFFKTLSQKYLVEITASEQELHALTANHENAALLGIHPGDPVLQIHIRFTTSQPGLNIYSRLFCNTNAYPIGNTYTH